MVSYALSIVCAQQLKAAYDADPVDGWARYHALCASGGSKLYAETLAAAGLELPYAPAWWSGWPVSWRRRPEATPSLRAHGALHFIPRRNHHANYD